MPLENIKTDDDMRAWIQSQKNNGWSLLHDLSKATPDELASFGYRNLSNAEAMKKFFDTVALDIEKRLQKYERENPR